MTMAASGIQEVKKVVCEKVAKSSVKGASVGCEEKSAASDGRRGVCKDHARSSVQALDVQVVLVQRDRSVESGCWFSESESEWLHEFCFLNYGYPGETVSCGGGKGWTKNVWPVSATGSKKQEKP